MSVNTEQKARRLLVDGRLRVERVRPKSGLIVATVQGDHGSYELGYDPDGREGLGEWRCTCMASSTFNRTCSHLLALQLVTAERPRRPFMRPDPIDDAKKVREFLRSEGAVPEDVIEALGRLATRR